MLWFSVILQCIDVRLTRVINITYLSVNTVVLLCIHYTDKPFTNIYVSFNFTFSF